MRVSSPPISSPVLTPARRGQDDPYTSRRAYAFRIGEAQALRRVISADAYLFLYKELVGLAGDRTYCWPGLEFLVATLGTSEGTVKRWIKELEKADLIRRKPRPGGQTSLTYITAFLQIETDTEPIRSQHDDNSDEAEALIPLDTLTFEGLLPASKELEPSSQQGLHPLQAPVFFGSDKEITSDQGEGSDMISHTFKIQQFKNPGRYGGDITQLSHKKPHTPAENEVATLVQAEHVLVPEALVELQNKPLEELQAVSKYLDKQTNVQSRPGLFVWLARQDFGARLIAGRTGCKNQRDEAHDITKYAAPPLLSEPGRAEAKSELASQWEQVLVYLSAILPKDAYDTWIKPTALVLLEDNLAFVATPNVFVRDEIEQTYKTQIEEALGHVYERPMVLMAVIG